MNTNYAFVIWVVIGLLAGLLSSVLTRGWKIALSDVVVGVSGAALGGMGATAMFGGGDGSTGPGAWLVVLGGACLLLGVWTAVQRQPA
jgi:uncharacterized membrane protein YeaQ/YmgE (transglycosylase-associated protein family)